nr:hypothetical protein [Streptomyces sp. AC550_RSS872]
MLQASATPQYSDRDHALVIGASIAGLLAAKVLAEHFGRVTLLDRDAIATDTTLRRGAPQGHHPHYMLERGALAMDEIFPGLRAQMSLEGVPIQDFGEAKRILLPYGWAPMATTGDNVQSFNRPFLERHLRERVLKLDNVELIGDFCVDGLTTTGSPPAVIGVHGRRNGTAQVVSANLIVDASGRASKLPDWLASIGLSRPAERTVEAEVSYTTRPYEGRAGRRHPRPHPAPHRNSGPAELIRQTPPSRLALPRPDRRAGPPDLDLGRPARPQPRHHRRPPRPPPGPPFPRRPRGPRRPRLVCLDDDPDNPVAVTGFKATRARKLTTGQKGGQPGPGLRTRPVEHGFAHLKNWRALTKLRTDPARATHLLRVLLVGAPGALSGRPHTTRP